MTIPGAIFPSRFTGSIVCDGEGCAVPYALFNLEPRGRLFLVPGEPVYEGHDHRRAQSGQRHQRQSVQGKETQATWRAANKDENVILSPVLPMTLERALHFVREDEMVEVNSGSCACARPCSRPRTATSWTVSRRRKSLADSLPPAVRGSIPGLPKNHHPAMLLPRVSAARARGIRPPVSGGLFPLLRAAGRLKTLPLPNSEAAVMLPP